MASKYLQKFPIPAGFQQILSDFTREVLRDQPANIIQYAAQYFQMLEKGKKLEFDSKYNVRKDDKKYQLNYNAKNADEITKKASNITQKLNKGSEIAPNNRASIHTSNRQSVHQPSQNVIGTEKTVTGQQTSQYVNSLTNKFSDETSPEALIERAIQDTVSMLFNKYDVDKNGYLSSNEIDKFVKEVVGEMGEGVEIQPEEIQHFVQEVDKDNDGKISRQELAKFIKKLVNLQSEQ